MVPRQKDVIPRGVVVVPQGQGVIPWRPRGGASCKGVIPRRPRGDASLLGHNSTATWWCLDMRIRIVKSWSLIPVFDISDVMLVIYVWPETACWLWWYKILYSSLPCCSLVCCVWSSLLPWSSTLLMWADVRTPGCGDGNRNAAAWWMGQVLGLLRGPLLEYFTIYVVLSEQDLGSLIVLFPVLFGLGRVGPVLCNWVYPTYGILLCSKLRTLWTIHVCDVLFNLRLPSFWDVTQPYS